MHERTVRGGVRGVGGEIGERREGRGESERNVFSIFGKRSVRSDFLPRYRIILKIWAGRTQGLRPSPPFFVLSVYLEECVGVYRTCSGLRVRAGRAGERKKIRIVLGFSFVDLQDQGLSKARGRGCQVQVEG